VVNAFDRHAADCIVAETNFGGAMVQSVVQAAAADAKVRVRFKEVRASRGKVVRAEPVAALYEQGHVHLVGVFPALEDQMISFTTNG
jgi:phage terminase large subunit-like protein